jgi:hypothetical protein
MLSRYLTPNQCNAVLLTAWSLLNLFFPNAGFGFAQINVEMTNPDYDH